MARPLRIEYEDAWYHIMNRGAARKNIFLNDLHRNEFLSLLDQVYRKYKIEIHAYCLMSNHYHLLVRTPIANLNKAMRHLNSVYAQLFNRSQNKDGSLFRGRYKAILINEEEYLFRVSQYIHLNPVEAKICLKPEDYLWSSYRYYLGKLKAPHWLFCEKVLEYSNSSNCLTTEIDKEMTDFYKSLKKIPILGSKDFIKKVKDEYIKIGAKEIPEQKLLEKIFIPSIDFVIQTVAKFHEVNIEEVKFSKRGFFNLPRALAIYFAVELCQMSFCNIGICLGNITTSGISNAYNRIINKAKTDIQLRSKICEILAIIEKDHGEI